MDRKIWENPRVESALDEAQVPLWFWNDKLEQQELLRQLRMQTDIGVTCTNPHARTNQGEGYIGGYLDEDWFDKIDTVVNYKRKMKETMWLYDEIDWPAGTCNQTITRQEELREEYLTFTKIEIPAGEEFRAQLKDLQGKSVFAYGADNAMEYAFNVYIFDKKTGKPYDIKNHFKYLIFGPELAFCQQEDAVAYIVKIQIDAYEYGGNGQVSYINGDATKAFLESTYEKYYERYPNDFGKTITAIFNDETRMCNAFVWSKCLPQEFQRRKGYSLFTCLIDLITTGEEAGRTKCDYFDVVASLYQENYFGVLQKWCKDHHIRLFAHLLGEETMYGHARYSGDYLRQNKYLDIPGADHLGKGIGSLNIKYTAAGAHSYGKDVTAVEVFAGCGWDMTFEEYIRMVTWMFQMGMKIIINHGFFYSDRGKRKNDWPPSQFFQWQGYPRMEEGNQMIRRLHYALTGGVTEAEVLVYHPMESFWQQYEPDANYYHGFAEGSFLKNDKAKDIDKEMQILLNTMLSDNVDFELLHKDVLSHFSVKENVIENHLNGQKFSVLVIPLCRVLPIEAAKLMVEFARGGGKIVIIGEKPIYAMPRGEDALLKEYMETLYEMEGVVFLPIENKAQIVSVIEELAPAPIQIIAGKSKTVNNHPHYPDYLIDPYIHTGEDLTGVMFVRYVKENRRNTLFMNYGSVQENITVLVRDTTTESIELWDVLSGDIKVLDKREREDGCLVTVLLPAGHGVVLTHSL